MHRSVKRSAVSAGVCAAIMKYHNVRSLAISLTIVLVITRSQAGGFTIRKADNWDSTTELDIGESSYLAVKYDLKSTTEFKLPNSSHTKGETGSRVISISDASNVKQVTAPVPVERNEATQQRNNKFSEDGINKAVSSKDLDTSTQPNKEVNDSSASIKIDKNPTSPMIIENSKGEFNSTKTNENDTKTTEIPTSFTNTIKVDGSSSDIVTTDTINLGSPNSVNVSSGTMNSYSPSSDNVSLNTMNSYSPSSDNVPPNTTDSYSSSSHYVPPNTMNSYTPSSENVSTNSMNSYSSSSHNVSLKAMNSYTPSSDNVSTNSMNSYSSSSHNVPPNTMNSYTPSSDNVSSNIMNSYSPSGENVSSNTMNSYSPSSDTVSSNTMNSYSSSSHNVLSNTMTSYTPSSDNVSSNIMNSYSPSGDNVSSNTMNSYSPSSNIVSLNTMNSYSPSSDSVSSNTMNSYSPSSDNVYSNTTNSYSSSSDNVSTNITKSERPSSEILSTELTNMNNATQSLEYNSAQLNTEIYEGSTEAIIDITPKLDDLLSGNETNLEISKTEINDANTTEASPDATKFISIKIDQETTTEVNTNTLLSIDQIITDITFEPSSDTTIDNREPTTIDTVSDTTGMNLENNSSATTEFQTGETFNTETLSEEISTTMLPHWKVYKTINRKRPTTTSVEDTTTSELEMTKSETARFSLERVLNNTPIPSLEELKNDLLNAQDYSPNMLDKINASDPKIDVDNQTTKLEVVSSKRAGYLDNKETTTMEPPQLVTAVMYEDKEIANDTENFGTMYESEGGDGEAGYLPDIQNATRAESRSQLVEDAIKEELLMEKTLNENNFIKEEARQRDSRPVKTDSLAGPDELSTPEIITEDLLSVKPINSEKRKTNSIYVTSSVTYKPLKKLDVQHPKQFVRDPDDNSWRNESISSLGIVFKPKNASKSFTEVLKNKTTELSNIVEKVDKSNVPDLRVRLEKIAEVRKSKKKRINKFGDTVYSDYEENSSENANTSKEDTTSPIVTSQKEDISTTTPLTPSKTETDLTVNAIWKDKTNFFKDVGSTTEKLKKFYNLADYYDATDDYDADYVTLSKIDLKRFTVPVKSGKDSYSATRPPDTYATRPVELTTKPMSITYMPDRQPTIQYFPPTKKVTTPASQKLNVNDYDDRFNKKLNMYVYKDTPKIDYDVTFATPSLNTKKFEQPTILTPKPVYTSSYQAANVDKNLYLTTRPHVTEPEPQGGFIPNDGSFNRASYVIKHYKDFINDAAKADDEKESEYLPYTESPIRGVTVSEVPNLTVQKEVKHVEDYDYDTNFRKDIMTRFVDNFNQNSERFKVDFPILYNNSVVHRKDEPNGKVLASSSAFMKRLYETANPRSQFLMDVKPCNANCEAMTVDLSPAYELHYYVPDQEEKEEIEARPNALPYRNYRL